LKNNIKGIILAGGHGSRLLPLTRGISKQLLPVYDKPMIYYPLSTLMLSGIREILIISTPRDLPRFVDLLGDGSKIGLKISYKEQLFPNGIAESFIIGTEFIEGSNVCLILGDNIFYKKNFNKLLMQASKNLYKGKSTIFSTEVKNSKEFGVIEYNENNEISMIVEKPNYTKSNNIVTGLYFYTNDVIEIAAKLKPSKRGELEITEINQYYLDRNKLEVLKLESNSIWSDTGTFDSLIETSKYFYEYENKTGNKIGCVEEIALKLGYVNKSEFIDLCNSMVNSKYGKYLLKKAEKY
tara:strand:+ start:4466 stop:5353 length:888 start_codon:yes stop_codon:yes gene_type:complete